MAKKTVAIVQNRGSKGFAKVVKMIKSPKTGAYIFKEAIVPKEKVKDFLKNN